MIDTSSFFWLGLVGSVFAALVLTALRTRRNRLAGENASSPRRIPPVAPKLWDAYITPNMQDSFSEGTVALNKDWEQFFPLSLTRIPGIRRKIPVPSAKSSTFMHPLRHPSGSHEVEYKRIVVGNAQLSTIILLPREDRVREKLHDQANLIIEAIDQEDTAYQFAVGTTCMTYIEEDTSS